MNPQIQPARDFIAQQVASGQTVDQAAAALRSSGWQESMVQEAIAAYNSPSISAPASTTTFFSSNQLSMNSSSSDNVGYFHLLQKGLLSCGIATLAISALLFLSYRKLFVLFLQAVFSNTLLQWLLFIGLIWLLVLLATPFLVIILHTLRSAALNSTTTILQSCKVALARWHIIALYITIPLLILMTARPFIIVRLAFGSNTVLTILDFITHAILLLLVARLAYLPFVLLSDKKIKSPLIVFNGASRVWKDNKYATLAWFLPLILFPLIPESATDFVIGYFAQFIFDQYQTLAIIPAWLTRLLAIMFIILVELLIFMVISVGLSRLYAKHPQSDEQKVAA